MATKEPKTVKEPKYISRAVLLKKDGWNSAAIKRILGDPDKLIEATEEGKKPKQRYLLKRVLQAEDSGKLANFNAKRETRQAQKSQQADASKHL